MLHTLSSLSFLHFKIQFDIREFKFKEGSTWFITETINCLTSKSDWHITSPTLSPPHHTLKKGIDHQLEGA